MVYLMILTAIMRVNGWVIPWWIWAIEIGVWWTQICINLANTAAKDKRLKASERALLDALNDMAAEGMDDGK